jgi:hypothetical protein
MTEGCFSAAPAPPSADRRVLGACENYASSAARASAGCHYDRSGNYVAGRPAEVYDRLLVMRVASP